jgi:hypothetical protein
VPRRKKNYAQKEKVEEKKEPHFCNLQLKLEPETGHVGISMDWSEGIDIRHVGMLISTIATGEILPPILGEVSEILKESGRPDLVDAVHDVIKERMQEHMRNIPHEEDFDISELEEEEDPLIAPINAMRHQLTMYGNMKHENTENDDDD